MPDGYLRASRDFEVDVACWRNDPDDGLGDIGERDATVLAVWLVPCGPQLLAYELGRDVERVRRLRHLRRRGRGPVRGGGRRAVPQRHLEIDPRRGCA